MCGVSLENEQKKSFVSNLKHARLGGILKYLAQTPFLSKFVNIKICKDISRCYVSRLDFMNIFDCCVTLRRKIRSISALQKKFPTIEFQTPTPSGKIPPFYTCPFDKPLPSRMMIYVRVGCKSDNDTRGETIASGIGIEEERFEKTTLNFQKEA